MTQVSRRLASIDSFRALTMFLMIFVNDLISVKGVPAWLEHAGEMEDRMGLADVVFPAFLFIMGVSIPFAMDQRKARGPGQSFWDRSYVHVIMRSLALLVMGIFQVNYEEYNRTDFIISRYWWLLWITIGFFLVWMDYPRDMARRKKLLLQGGGILLLVVMALLYKGGEHDHVIWMRPHWYGILGLIGWCYLICALSYLWIGNRVGLLTVLMMAFLGICIADSAHALHFFRPLRQFIWIVGSGSLPFITMAGVITALVYRRATEKGKPVSSFAVLAVIALVLLAGGFALRPLWGISKIKSTPSWVMICAAISIVVYIILAWLIDLKGKKAWAAPIRPAGTSTLTAYLLPYIHFAIAHMLGEAWRLPPVLRTGWVGVIKCLLYAFVIIGITGLLEKRKIRLSI